MMDRDNKPRGFGFVTFENYSVLDTVMADTHVIDDKQVECKISVPKPSFGASTKISGPSHQPNKMLSNNNVVH